MPADRVTSRRDPVQLTDIFLRKLKPSGERYEVTDSVQTGLRVRVSADGKISFILKCRDAGSRLRTVTIGRYPDLSLKEARDRATRLRQALKDGVDINAEKRAGRASRSGDAGRVTLAALVSEFKAAFQGKKKVWAPSGPKTTRSQAERCIEAVFSDLLGKPADELTTADFARSVGNYKPKRPLPSKSTANGQASRARAYLKSVLDWAAGRGRFRHAGAGRKELLQVVDLSEVFDPARDDPTITGESDRVLEEQELRAILPLLAHPAPPSLGLRLRPEQEYRPIAMRFILLTAARREEVVQMRWRDLDFSNGIWRKPSVKSTRGGPRKQNLPLSGDAVALLKSLPGFEERKPGAFVFPNAVGGPLGNWPRVQSAIERASGTSGWHRHDLRRTAATLMHALQVPVSTIDQILAHADPLKRENASASASHYVRLTGILSDWKDPQLVALERLAEAIRQVEGGHLV